MINITNLTIEEIDRFKTIRLRSLREDPDAFGTTFEEADLWTMDKWKFQVENIQGFLASEGERDVGLVRVAIDQDDQLIGWLISMWVAPENRGKKIGSRLIDAAIKWSQQNNLRRLKLDVADFNKSAISLYESKGFKPNGVLGSLPAPRTHIKEHQRELKL